MNSEKETITMKKKNIRTKQSKLKKQNYLRQQALLIIMDSDDLTIKKYIQ